MIIGLHNLTLRWISLQCISQFVRNTLTNWFTIFLIRKLSMRITFLSWARLSFSLTSCCSSLVVVFLMPTHSPIYRRSKSKVPYIHEVASSLPSMQTPSAHCKACTIICVTHTLHHVYTIHLATYHHKQPSIFSNVCWPCRNGWTPHFSPSIHMRMTLISLGLLPIQQLVCKTLSSFLVKVFVIMSAPFFIGVNFLYFQWYHHEYLMSICFDLEWCMYSSC